MDRRTFGKAMGLCLGATCVASSALGGNSPEGMSIFEAILQRHSVRAYTSEPVSKEDVERLLRLAMQAPSAVNEQPWEFIVIRDKSLLDQVGSINHWASFASKAPVAILLCLNEKKEKEKGMGIIDMGACAENLMLAATGMGLGSVFTGIYPHKDRMDGFANLCQLPEYVQPIGLIILGYPAIKDHTPVDRFNADAVHYNIWDTKKQTY